MLQLIRETVGFIMVVVGIFMVVYADPLHDRVNFKRAAIKSVIGLVWLLLGLQLILR